MFQMQILRKSLWFRGWNSNFRPFHLGEHFFWGILGMAYLVVLQLKLTI